MKYKSSKYINDFNFIFNIFTILNILSLFFIYKKIDINNFYKDISLFILFIIIEFSILIIILYISKIREDIYNEIFSDPIIDKFIRKKYIYF